LQQASTVPLSAAQALPFYTNGMRIGLLGGSFNPPHAAHRAISLFALKRLQLDRVWWLLTPGNPLKNHDGLHALNERAALPTIRASTSLVSKLSLASATLSTRSSTCAVVSPACTLSGSWALTISRNFIAGKIGGASRPMCRLP
jgi:nicotinate-nucleotide adenylyltransferase